MSTFTTAYFASVLFGIAILIGYALRRFEEHAAGVPDVFRSMQLTPRLMSRPDRYRRGLALYIGCTLLIYVLITLAPQHFLAVVQSFGGQGSGADATKDLISSITASTGPALPLAVALLMTSNAFVRFANGPELFLRRICQKVAGIPEELSFVTSVLRRTAIPSAERMAPLCKAMQMPMIDADVYWPRQQTAHNSWRRAVAIADALTNLQNASATPDRSPDTPELDPRVYGNFWRLAQPRISELRTLSKRVQADRIVQDRNLTDLEDQRIGSWDIIRDRINAVYDDLNGLLAAALATSGIPDLRGPARQLHLIVHDNDAADLFIQQSARMRRRTSDLAKTLALTAIVLIGAILAVFWLPRFAGIFLPTALAAMLPNWTRELPDQLSVGAQLFQSPHHAVLFVLSIVAVLGAAVTSSWLRRERLLVACAYVHSDDRRNVSVATYFELGLSAAAAALVVLAVINLLPLLGFVTVIVEYLEAARIFGEGCSQWGVDLHVTGESGMTLIFVIGAASFLLVQTLGPVAVALIVLGLADLRDTRVGSGKLPKLTKAFAFAVAAAMPVLASQWAGNVLTTSFDRAIGEIRMTMSEDEARRFGAAHRRAYDALGLTQQTSFAIKTPPPRPPDRSTSTDEVAMSGADGTLLSQSQDLTKLADRIKTMTLISGENRLPEIIGFCQQATAGKQHAVFSNDQFVRRVGAPMLKSEPCSCAIAAQEVAKGWVGHSSYVWFAGADIFPTGGTGGTTMPTHRFFGLSSALREAPKEEGSATPGQSEQMPRVELLYALLTIIIYLVTTLVLWRKLYSWQREDIGDPAEPIEAAPTNS